MSLQILPVPVPHAAALRVYWEPWLLAPSRRNADGYTNEEEIERVLTGRVVVVLIWDDEERTSRGALGIQLETDSKARLWAHMVWCMGSATREWGPLLPQLERWAREHLGCHALKATARPGWKKLLRASGYVTTHVVMQKVIS